MLVRLRDMGEEVDTTSVPLGLVSLSGSHAESPESVSLTVDSRARRGITRRYSEPLGPGSQRLGEQLSAETCQSVEPVAGPVRHLLYQAKPLERVNRACDCLRSRG